MGLFNKRTKAANSLDQRIGAKGLTVNISSLLSGTAKSNPIENSAVVAALRWINRNVAAAPQIVQRMNGGRYETIQDHEAARLLRSPNLAMTGRALSQAIALSLVLDGNAYIYKCRNANGRVVELQYLPHSAVRLVIENGVLLRYEYRASSKTQTIEIPDMIHIRDGVDPCEVLRGWSGLNSIIREILTDNEATIYTHSILKNLGIAGLVISPNGDGVITEDQADLVKAKLKSETTGNNRGEPIIAGQSIKIDTVGLTPEDMVLDKIRNVPESRILAVIGLPALVLGLSSGSDTKTYSNYAEARSASVEDWLLPFWQLIDEALSASLLTEFGETNARITRDLSEVRALAEDTDSLADRVTLLYINGVITRAEARRMMGLSADDQTDNIYYLDAQAAGLSTDQAKSLVRAELLSKRRSDRGTAA
jgi:HK97 family phage portal protein